ncbi:MULTISPECIES: DUF4180 domain-containing protein [unclassified Leptospira]|uniref:DUF4180 domain-containing protein n=1 Tax=unclassified Leptospira TaxID=2633828 RepID=UPI0002BED2F4|nr:MULTISPECIES: DUF4180 domain-containing protein [unclassified Leptospira]EMK00974.1 PF13788 domain protein [Leptospira sp. B5-022]MCR1794686.1 DUF4180 domain-containing protein [Leptospira sp. id769339]
MVFEELETEKGSISFLQQKDYLIQELDSFFDLIYSAKSDTIAVHSSHLPEHFFDLKTGFAGEIFQKITNYQKRFIILGDYSNITSKSFNDLIYESNKNGKVIFSETLEAAIRLLK